MLGASHCSSAPESDDAAEAGEDFAEREPEEAFFEGFDGPDSDLGFSSRRLKVGIQA
jgi:hypothetical protein